MVPKEPIDFGNGTSQRPTCQRCGYYEPDPGYALPFNRDVLDMWSRQ